MKFLDHAQLGVFHRKSGRLDAQLIAAQFGVSIPDLARAIGRDPSGVRRRPDAPGLQYALIPLHDILRRLSALFCDERQNMRVWLHAPHPDFGGVRPIDYVREGQLEPLRSLIAAMENRFGS